MTPERRANPATVGSLLADAPPAWRSLFRRHGLGEKPSVAQVLTLLERTPSGASAGPKGKGTFAVPKNVSRAAWRGLVLAHKHNYASESGIGLARAFQLATKPTVPERTVRRMKAYFDRHTSDRDAANFGNDVRPSRGYIAWLNWGGDPGQRWAEHVLTQLDDEGRMRRTNPHHRVAWRAADLRTPDPRTMPQAPPGQSWRVVAQGPDGSYAYMTKVIDLRQIPEDTIFEAAATGGWTLYYVNAFGDEFAAVVDLVDDQLTRNPRPEVRAALLRAMEEAEQRAALRRQGRK